MNTLKIEIVVPDWVNWIAVDKDGGGTYFENEPFPDGVWWRTNGGQYLEIYQGTPPKNWKDELYTWS